MVDLLLVPDEELPLPDLCMIILMHQVNPIAHPLDLSVQTLLPQGRRLECVVPKDQPVQGLSIL
jgi:hypothetical protein